MGSLTSEGSSSLRMDAEAKPESSEVVVFTLGFLFGGGASGTHWMTQDTSQCDDTGHTQCDDTVSMMTQDTSQCDDTVSRMTEDTLSVMTQPV